MLLKFFDDLADNSLGKSAEFPRMLFDYKEGMLTKFFSIEDLQASVTTTFTAPLGYGYFSLRYQIQFSINIISAFYEIFGGNLLVAGEKAVDSAECFEMSIMLLLMVQVSPWINLAALSGQVVNRVVSDSNTNTSEHFNIN